MQVDELIIKFLIQLNLLKSNWAEVLNLKYEFAKTKERSLVLESRRSRVAACRIEGRDAQAIELIIAGRDGKWELAAKLGVAARRNSICTFAFVVCASLDSRAR